MKKIVILLSLSLFALTSYGQVCCNVVSSDGINVVTSNGICVVAPNLESYSDCAPDSDGDGVPDDKDHCPNEAGTKESDGCPELKEDEKAVLKSALEGVNFLSGKDVLTEESKPKLHNVAMLLKAHPGFKLEVSGYTDSSGDEASNLALSKKRANAVKNYLLEDGISNDRIIAEGYGESNPVADNESEEGKAKNRRVEFAITH